MQSVGGPSIPLNYNPVITVFRKFLLHSHVWLVGAYIPIFLYSQNLGRFSLSVIFNPLLCIVSCQFVLWLVGALIMRDRGKAAIFMTLQTMVFFGYGFVYDGLRQSSLAQTIEFLGWNNALFLGWLLVSIFVLYRLLPLKETSRGVHFGLHLTALALLAVPFFHISKFYFSERSWSSKGSDDATGQQLIEILGVRPSQGLPDIYQIILDAHTRLDVLREVYGHDAEDFSRYLENEGFHIANKAYSNYSSTHLSLTSMLNFEYLQTLVPDLNENSTDLNVLNDLKGNPRIVRILRELGYRYIALQNGWEREEGEYADTFIGPERSLTGLFLNEFANGILFMTPIPYINRSIRPGASNNMGIERERILWFLEFMKEVHVEKGPKFVFAHVLSPHVPILFGPNGEPIDDFPEFSELRITNPRMAADGVSGQSHFLHTHLKEIIHSLKKNTQGNAIILIHSDHGEALSPYEDGVEHVWQQHASLHALYLPPGMDRSQFSEQLTLVNTFRIILNAGFGAKLPLLEDRIFYSGMKKRFLFQDYTDSLGGPESLR